MDREQLIQYFNKSYMPRRDVLARLPLGVPISEIWQQIMEGRQSRAVTLPLHNARGEPFWLTLTDSMVSASEKIVEETIQPMDPQEDAAAEEAYYTSFLEGSPMTVEEAIDFYNRSEEPGNIREQLLYNNRQAIAYASAQTRLPITEGTICTLAGLLTERIVQGGRELRQTDMISIASMKGEKIDLPAAAQIPERMRELCAYLNDPEVHPLLKAGVAHAWFMAVRPFSSGNERLARLLSYMLLLRARYAFFSELPLSGLIAQDSYGYFEAMANTLREGDMTYLIEHYLAVLGRAVDELHQRRQEAEETMGDWGLAQEADDSLHLDTAFASGNGLEQDGLQKSDPVGTALNQAGFEPVKIEKAQGALTHEELREKLEILISRTSEYTTPVAQRLLQWLETGKHTFSRPELTDGIVPLGKRSWNILGQFKERGLIVSKRWNRDHAAMYALNLKESSAPPVDETPNDMLKEWQEYIDEGYSPEVLDTIESLINSTSSPRDRRIGIVIRDRLRDGYIEISDYMKIDEPDKWIRDMKLCEQMGLVSRDKLTCYRINKKLYPGFEHMDRALKRAASAFYDQFGNETFTSEMIVSTLDYPATRASAVLHTFTLMRILDCSREDMNYYKFRITPAEHPECFARAF